MPSVLFLTVVLLSLMNEVAQSRNEEPEVISEELEERTNRKIKRETFGEIETYQRRLLDQFTSVLEPKLKSRVKENPQRYKDFFSPLPTGQRDTSKIINRKIEHDDMKNLSFPPFKRVRQGYWPGFSPPDNSMSLDLSSWQNPQFSSQMPDQFSSPYFSQFSSGMPQSFQSSPLSPLTQQGFPSMIQPFSSSSFSKLAPPFSQSPSYSSPFMPQMDQFSSF